MKKVGVIGLGVMGQPMARNLIKKGYTLTVYDVKEEKTAAVAAAGARAADSAAEVVQNADVIVLSFPTQQIMESVMLGADQIGSVDIQGKTFIDTTTATMHLAQKVSTAIAVRGGDFLDAPVTGGAKGAEDATLSIMIGGSKQAFEQHRDVFDTLGRNIVYIGESGHGQVSKMVNQLLMGAIYCSIGEAFGFAAHLGVDVEKVYQAVENGGASSGLLSGAKQFILTGGFALSGNMGQHGKDIDYVMEEANRSHSFMPVTAAVHQVWNLARIFGLSEWSAQSMYTVWERIHGQNLDHC